MIAEICLMLEFSEKYNVHLLIRIKQFIRVGRSNITAKWTLKIPIVF